MNAESVLRQFVDTINATGGVRKAPEARSSYYSPVADPEWIDLGLAYIEACRVLNVKPVISER